MLMELKKRRCHLYTFSSSMSYQLRLDKNDSYPPNTRVNMVLEVGSYIAFYVL